LGYGVVCYHAVMRNFLLLLLCLVVLGFAERDIDLYQNAKTLYKQGDYQQAFALLQLIPERSVLNEYVQYYYFRTGILAGATASLKEKILIYNPSQATAFEKELKILEKYVAFSNGEVITEEELLSCGKYFLAVSQFQQAGDCYRAVSKNRNYFQERDFGLIQVYSGQGFSEKAAALLLKQSYSDRKLLYLARFARGRQQTEYYRELVQDFPESTYAADAAYVLFSSYLRNRDYEQALEYLRFLENKSFYREMAVFEKGYIYYSRGHYQTALVNFRKVPEGPSRPESLYWEARTLQKLGQPKASIALLQLLVQQYPFSYYAYLAVDDGQKIELNLDEIAINQSKARKVPARLKALIKAGSWDDAIYEMEVYYQQDLSLWEYLAESILKAQEYNYLLQANRYLKNKYYAYPLAYEELVNSEALKYSLDRYLIWAVMREESHFQTRALSSSKAKGLMQFMDRTAEMVAQKLSLISYDIYEPEISIKFGAYYLNSLLKQFGFYKGIMAYNCGPGNVAKYDSKEDMATFVENFPLPETRRYIKKVLGTYWSYKLLYSYKQSQ